jgi:hypothetical protein
MALLPLQSTPRHAFQQSQTDALVSVNPLGGYSVDFGYGVKPRLHQVDARKWLRCSCELGAGCPAVDVVTAYLRNGGERAPQAPQNFLVTAPKNCLVCGAPAYFDPKLSSRIRGAGWGCSQAGQRHYYAWRAQLTRDALKANPWRFPPVVVRDGAQTYAWDGILAGDVVLYPGVLRADLITDGPIGYLE